MLRKINISIVMATYNGSKYISEQLMSILGQSVLPQEIVLVDDASYDNTIDIVERILSEGKIKYSIIQHEINRGISQTFEDGIKNANCEYVMICDQDDIWNREKIKETKRVIELYKDVVLAVCDADIVNECLNSKKLTMFHNINLPLIFKNDYCILNQMQAIDLLLKRNYITGMCMAVKREIAIEAIPFSNNMTYDSWISWIAAQRGKIAFINKVLVLYRQHENNAIGVKKSIYLLKGYNHRRMKRKSIICKKYEDMYHSSKSDYARENSLNGYEFHLWRESINKKKTIMGLIGILNHRFKGNYVKYSGNPMKELIKDVIEIILFRNVE